MSDLIVSSVVLRDAPPGWVEVTLTTGASTALPAESAIAHGIQPGQRLSLPEWEALQAESAFEEGKRLAVAWLSRKAYTERELWRRLRRTPVDEETARRVVDWLVDRGWIDDRQYAAHWVEGRLRHKPLGRRRLAAELRHRGVAPEIVREEIEQQLDPESEEALAIQIARERSTRMRGADPAVVRRRLAGFLLRRGFPEGVVRRALRTVLGEAGETDETFWP